MIFSLTETLVIFVGNVLLTVGIPGLLLLMTVESFGIPPLPSEVILPLSGMLVAEGKVGLIGIPFNWETVMAAALAGGLLGAIMAYVLGRLYGMAFIHRIGRHLALDEKDLRRAEKFFERRGEVTVFLSRMAPIIRAYISYPAGAAKMDLPRFSLFTLAGSFPFALGLVYAGYILGKNFYALGPYFNILDLLGVIALIILAILFYRGRSAPPLAKRIMGSMR